MTGIDTDKVGGSPRCSQTRRALPRSRRARLLLFQVNTYIEDRIAQKEKLTKILRLMCMQSVCNNGLKQKVLDYYKREIFQVNTKVVLAQLNLSHRSLNIGLFPRAAPVEAPM